MTELLTLSILTFVISGMLSIYLRGLLKIKTPMALQAKIVASVAWVFFAIVILTIFAIGLNIISEGALGMNKLWAIAPIAFGFLASLLLDKNSWKLFNQKFSSSKSQ